MRITSFFFIFSFFFVQAEAYSQTHINPTLSNTDIVLQFFEGVNQPEKIQASLDLLTDDYKFTNPMVSLSSKVEFINLMMEIGKVVTEVEMLHTSEEGDWVATFYIFKSNVPGVESNYASEWFRIENGKIQESKMIYDATKWRAIYAQMGE